MFGEHAAFIIPAYLVSFAGLALLAVYIILTHARRRHELEKLERRIRENDTDVNRPQ